VGGAAGDTPKGSPTMGSNGRGTVRDAPSFFLFSWARARPRQRGRTVAGDVLNSGSAPRRTSGNDVEVVGRGRRRSVNPSRRCSSFHGSGAGDDRPLGGWRTGDVSRSSPPTPAAEDGTRPFVSSRLLGSARSRRCQYSYDRGRGMPSVRAQSRWLEQGRGVRGEKAPRKNQIEEQLPPSL